MGLQLELRIEAFALIQSTTSLQDIDKLTQESRKYDLPNKTQLDLPNLPEGPLFRQRYLF